MTAAASGHPSDGPVPRRSHRRLSRALGIGFGVLMLALVGWMARKVEWSSVGGALSGYGAGTIAAATLAALTSHLLYSFYDRIGMKWAGLHHPARRIMRISFTSYAFNLNFGPLVGALAMRVRMYSRLGLSAEAIARIVGVSVVTNWLGYAVLGGAVFLLGDIRPPGDWAVGRTALQAIGAALWLAVAAYVATSAWAGGRDFSLRGGRWTVPRLRMAAVQLTVSCGHWLATAAVLCLLFRQQVGYAEVLAVFLLAAVAGAIAHIPAGLGVLEAVFVGLLAPPLATPSIIAALLVYRAVYYLLPLGLAIVLYLSTELKPGR